MPFSWAGHRRNRALSLLWHAPLVQIRANPALHGLIQRDKSSWLWCFHLHNLHVVLTVICHRHDYDLMWFGHRDTVVYGNAGGNWSANWIEL